MRSVSLIVIGCVLAAAQAIPALASESAGTAKRLVLVTHGDPKSEPFWQEVHRGALDAAQEHGVKVEHRAPKDGPITPGMQHILAEVLADPPDGLIVSVPSLEAVEALIKRGAETPPLMTINSGFDLSREVGSMLHIGQPERKAGQIVGRHLAARGIGRVVCINHEPSNQALAERCRGIADELPHGVVVFDVDLATVELDKLLAEALASSPPPQAVVALGENTLAKLVQWQIGSEGHIPLVGFDPPVQRGIPLQAAVILFVVDQQAYLQGYLSVFFMTQHLLGRGLPQSDIWSGPALRDPSSLYKDSQ